MPIGQADAVQARPSDEQDGHSLRSGCTEVHDLRPERLASGLALSSAADQGRAAVTPRTLMPPTGRTHLPMSGLLRLIKACGKGIVCAWFA